MVEGVQQGPVLIHHEGSMHHNTSATDHQWPPWPNTADSRTSRSSGAADDATATKPAMHNAGDDTRTSHPYTTSS